MTFISYAQNAEDVLLWRALGHIKNGFYIDVGANDPVEHSVTKAFYDAGWQGINIEPLPGFHQAFMEQRPRDVNLAIAAGSREGDITLYDVAAVNGWASSDPAVAAAHRAEGYEVTELTVPVRTLSAVCAEHAGGTIHFLKIDVEGFEGEVLRGMDLVRWRPWVMVVEATMPNSRVTNHQTWEALVTDRGYRFAWFDGLNRYYVANEHPELLAALSVQPNVFDEFISHHLDKAWSATKRASAAGDEARQRAAEAEGRQWNAEKRTEAAIAAAHQASELSRAVLDKFEQANARAEQELVGKVTAQQWAATLTQRIEEQQAQAVLRQEELRAVQSQAAAQLQAAGQQLEAARHELDVAQQEIAATRGQRDAAQQELAATRRQRDASQLNLENAQLELAAARDALRAVTAQDAALRDELQMALTNSHHVSVWAQGLEQEVLAMRASSSWRMTAPWRATGAALQSLRRGSSLRPLVLRITANERMRRLLIPLLLRFPALAERVAQTVSTIKQAAPPAATPEELAVPEELKALPESARKVLGDLKRTRRNPQDD